RASLRLYLLEKLAERRVLTVEMMRVPVAHPHHVIDDEIVLERAMPVPDVYAIGHLHQLAFGPVPGTPLEKGLEFRGRVSRVGLVAGAPDRSGQRRRARSQQPAGESKDHP